MLSGFFLGTAIAHGNEYLQHQSLKEGRVASVYSFTQLERQFGFMVGEMGVWRAGEGSNLRPAA